MKDLSLHILDIAQNSIAAGAKNIRISVMLDQAEDLLTLEIEDDGRGMDERMQREALNPFVTTRTTRRVGMGLPLLKQGAEQSGGEVYLRSEVGKGTLVHAEYRISHIDRPPMGDIAGSILSLVMMNPALDFIYEIVRGGERTFAFTTKEVREQLGGVPVDMPEVLEWIREYLAEGTNQIAEV